MHKLHHHKKTNNKVYVLFKLTVCTDDEDCGANEGCRQGECTGKISKEVTLSKKYLNKNKVLVGCNQSKSNLIVECKKQGEECYWRGASNPPSFCCRSGLTCNKDAKIGSCRKIYDGTMIQNNYNHRIFYLVLESLSNYIHYK